MITTVVLATVLTNSLLATELESTARYDPGKQTTREALTDETIRYEVPYEGAYMYPDEKLSYDPAKVVDGTVIRS
jgi:hypothetical protein